MTSISSSRRSDMDHTVWPANNTMPTFSLRSRSPDGAATEGLWWQHLVAAYYSFIDPERMKGWVGLVGWPIATHISGHPSAVGWAQDSERSPVNDQRSTAEPRNPTERRFRFCKQFRCLYLKTQHKNVRSQWQRSGVICKQLRLLSYSTGKTYIMLTATC